MIMKTKMLMKMIFHIYLNLLPTIIQSINHFLFFLQKLTSKLSYCPVFVSSSLFNSLLSTSFTSRSTTQSLVSAISSSSYNVR